VGGRKEFDVKAARGSLTTRLARLEDRAASRASAVPEHRDEFGWLAVFERLGREGTFDHEPDFPVALAYFRTALERAGASTDPPFDPPPEFLPNHPTPYLRVELWRSAERFPEVRAGLDWLSEMLGRLVEGVPPVSEAEFAELAAWFGLNDAGLLARARPSELLDVGGGRRVWGANLRYSLAKGPRADGAGRVAEDVRQLRARYGSPLAEHRGG
jgi:hypothetical protein